MICFFTDYLDDNCIDEAPCGDYLYVLCFFTDYLEDNCVDEAPYGDYLYVICFFTDYLEDNCVDEAPYGDIFNLTDGVYKYGIVRVTRNEQYAPNLDCYLTVVAPPDYYLTVRIRSDNYTVT